MMPVMDGIDLCSKIKESQAQHIFLLFLLTAKSLEAQKTEGMSSGADMVYHQTI